MTLRAKAIPIPDGMMLFFFKSFNLQSKIFTLISLPMKNIALFSIPLVFCFLMLSVAGCKKEVKKDDPPKV